MLSDANKDSFSKGFLSGWARMTPTRFLRILFLANYLNKTVLNTFASNEASSTFCGRAIRAASCFGFCVLAFLASLGLVHLFGFGDNKCFLIARFSVLSPRDFICFRLRTGRSSLGRLPHPLVPLGCEPHRSIVDIFAELGLKCLM